MFAKHKNQRALALTGTTVMVISLAACGGSSSSSSGPGGEGTLPGNTDNTPTRTSLSELSGLNNHASQTAPLLYIDASRDNGETGLYQKAAPWLMSYDPQNGNKTPVDKKLSGLLSASPNHLVPQTVHGANVNTTSGEMTDYHIDSVMYFREQPRPQSSQSYCPSELMRADVGSINPDQITDVTGCSDRQLGALSTRQLVAFDLSDPKQSWYAFASEDQNGDRQYKMTPLDADNTTAPQPFATAFTVQSPLSHTQGPEAGTPYGWLVADEGQNDCLAVVDNDDLNDATCIPNADGSGAVLHDSSNSATITGVYHLKNGAIVSLPEPNQGNPLQTTNTLWFYQQGSGSDPGKLHLLKSPNDKELHTKALALSGTDEAGRTLVKDGGETLYMAVDDGGFGGLLAGGSPDPGDILDTEFHVNLLKITTANGNVGWEQVYTQGGKLGEGDAATLGSFLTDADHRLLLEINDQLISLDLNGNDKQILDGRNNSSPGLGAAFDAPTGVVSGGNWFFYNRDYNKSDYATAIKVDGSQRVELKNCRWIGTSTTGQANYAGNNFGNLQPSEVFMACNNKTLAAVDANDPEAGKVPLGTLPQKAETIEMGRTGLGPHRLARVTYDDGGEESYEVVYVDVSNSDSLKHLMDSPATDADVGGLAGLTAPINGF